MPDDEPLFEKPLDELLPSTRPTRPPRESDDYDRESRLSAKELFVIARLQRRWLVTTLVAVLCAIVGCVVMAAVPHGSDPTPEFLGMAIVFGLVFFPLGVLQLVFFIRLTVRLFEPMTVVLLLVLHFACGMGVVTVLVVNARATRTLRQNGLRVGLLGVRKADMRKLEGELPLTKLGW